MNIPSTGSSLNTMLLDSRMKAEISGIKARAESDAKKINGLQHAKEETQLRQVSQEFASLFMGEMFKAMGNNQDTSQIGFGGSAEEMFRDLSYEEYAKEAVKMPNNGLADIVYKSLMRRGQVGGNE